MAIVAAYCWLMPFCASAQEASPAQILEGILTPPRSMTEANSNESEPRRDEWETDRDSFTPSTKTAGRRRLIVESAYTFLDNRRAKETHSFPEFLLRYGVTERVELRLGWNYEVGGAANSVSGSTEGAETTSPHLEREHSLSYGIKTGITEQAGWIPESALILSGFTPTGGPDTATQFVAAYVFGWNLPNRWILDAGIRYSADSAEHDRFALWAPSVVLKAPIGERWDVHAEYFSALSRGKEHDSVEHYFSPGVHYLLTDDVEIGVRLGWGLNDQSARFFCNAGVGWRF